MQTVPTRDLRDRNGDLVRDAKAGKVSLVTKHGYPSPHRQEETVQPPDCCRYWQTRAFARINPIFYTASPMQCVEACHEKCHLAAPARG